MRKDRVASLVGHGILMLILGMTLGCAAKRQSGFEETALQPPMRPTSDALLAQAEAAWQAREDPDRLLEAIMLLKKVAQSSAVDRKVLVRLSRALYFYADGYLKSDEERIRKYDQGTYYGEKALAQNEDFKALLDRGTPVIEALEVLGEEDCEALYWTAANLGKWAKLKGIPTVIRVTPLFKAMLEKANALDDSYNYGGPPRTWGAYYAAAPAIAGGDLEKSQAFFERAMAIAPDYFANRVLMAELYAPKVHDRELFVRLLKSVVEGDPYVLPDVVAEQKVEQAKARKLLTFVDDYFPN